MCAWKNETSNPVCPDPLPPSGGKCFVRVLVFHIKIFSLCLILFVSFRFNEVFRSSME